MRTYDWTALLQGFNADLLASETLAEALRNDFADEGLVAAIKSGWLGFPGATEAQLVEAEERLGVSLPPDYRSFLATSNGWWHPNIIVPRLWSSEEIEWYAVTDPDTVESWASDSYGVSLEEHLVYGDEQMPEVFREEYLRLALRISEREDGGSAVFLLVPDVVTTDGEWEAWYHAHWLPGATRHPSFWDRMQYEWHSFRAYAEHDARRMLVTDPLDRLPAKLPGLIATILEETQPMRRRISEPRPPDEEEWRTAMDHAVVLRQIEGYEDIAERIRLLEAKNVSPTVLLAKLRELEQLVADEVRQARLQPYESYLARDQEARSAWFAEFERRHGREQAARKITEFLSDARDA